MPGLVWRNPENPKFANNLGKKTKNNLKKTKKQKIIKKTKNNQILGFGLVPPLGGPLGLLPGLVWRNPENPKIAKTLGKNQKIIKNHQKKTNPGFWAGSLLGGPLGLLLGLVLIMF